MPTRISPTGYGYSSLLNPNVTLDPRTRIGRRIRFGCSIIRSIASFFDLGSGRCLNTGLRVLTKSRKRSLLMCFSRNARSGGSRLMSRSSTSTPFCSRKLLALRQVVHVGFQKKVGFAMRAILSPWPFDGDQDTPPSSKAQGRAFDQGSGQA